MSVREALASGLPADADAPRPPVRVAMIGVSIDDPCGVRDHAVLLARALAREGVSSSSHWLSRDAATLAGGRAELAAWTTRLASELEQARPDALLLHYSVFAFSHRGVPLFVGPILAALRARDAPLVCVMHELAYPWRLGGVRGKVWAATQRVALIAVIRDSASLVVTAEARARWLRSRRWLPRRPVLTAPVFSNLPQAIAVEGATGPATPTPHDDVGAASGATAPKATLGLFGYVHEGVARETVLDALRLLHGRGSGVALLLLGAPGSGGPTGAAWIDAARARGVAELVGFSGRLPAQELADSLARCDVLLFTERGGPTSRKTTLAASLASGRPVVALDGASTWRELASARGAVIVAPDPHALADTIVGLLADGATRARQGERGRAFAARTMSAEHSAQVVAQAIDRAIAARIAASNCSARRA
ncbi:MAG TPA: glycosyltransferase family 4 protein [Solirubrobacteraceae bacterium]|jgi:glycosyltransferase involved in cell wall biosynthesis|nr:glycosyltransferase family 4 protein [Solirubrobacteraceae bacterium]